MRRAFMLAAAVALAACGGGGGGGTSKVHTYHAAASVGDFLTLTIDHDANTIEYVNITNGDDGTVPFTERSDGGLDVNDPNGDLVQCYEVPGQAVVCKGDSLGPDPTHAEPALLYGVLDEPLTKADLYGVSVGYLQFRTKEGGIEVGHVAFGLTGDATGTGYFPVRQVLPQPTCYGKAEYSDLEMLGTDMVDNPTYHCVDWTEPGHPLDVNHLFGTAGGDFMVDSKNGALFVFRDAASKDFDTANAGTYTRARLQEERELRAGHGESGIPEISTVTVVIDSSGSVTVTDGAETLVDSEALLPFEDSEWQGADKIVDPVHGLFYFRDAGDVPVFVTFFDDAMAFGQFTPEHVGDCTLDPQEPALYTYMYGIAVRAP